MIHLYRGSGRAARLAKERTTANKQRRSALPLDEAND